MADVLELRRRSWRRLRSHCRTEVDEAAARRTLREQIARLESELGALFCSTFPRTGFDWGVPSARRPARAVAAPSSSDIRDELADAARSTTASSSATAPTSRSSTAAASRRCCSTPPSTSGSASRTRTSASAAASSGTSARASASLGMLMNWWRVRISSGCPLAMPARAGPASFQWVSAAASAAPPRAPTCRRPVRSRAERDAARRRRAQAASARARAAAPAPRRARRGAPDDRRAPARAVGRTSRWSRSSCCSRSCCSSPASSSAAGDGPDPPHGRAGARLPRRPRAVDPRALRRLPLAHDAARGRVRFRGHGRDLLRRRQGRPGARPPAAGRRHRLPR